MCLAVHHYHRLLLHLPTLLASHQNIYITKLLIHKDYDLRVAFFLNYQMDTYTCSRHLYFYQEKQENYFALHL